MLTAARAAAARLSQCLGAPVTVSSARALLAVASAPTSPAAAPAGGERCFVRSGREWLSLALAGDAERERLQAWLAAVGATLHPSRGFVGLRRNAESVASRLQELGLAAAPAYPAPAAGAGTGPLPAPPGPPSRPLLESGAGRVLDGLRVVECGVAASAPFAGLLLGGLGASVTTVSHPARVSSRWHGRDPLVLDFGRPAELERFWDLCADSHLVIDNFRSRVWRNLSRNPLAAGARVHLRIPGFPDGDRRSNWRSFGFQIEAYTGTGAAPPAGGMGIVPAPQFAALDHAVALAGVARAVAALDGAPREVEVSQWSLAHQMAAAGPAAAEGT